MNMEKEGEDFLILDDDEFQPLESENNSKKPLLSIPNNIINKISRINKKNHLDNKNVDNIVDLEDSSILALDGVYDFDWKIRGMDCPDCAMKASKALRRLSGIEDCYVSATEGRVRVSLLSLIHISEPRDLSTSRMPSSA